MEVEESLPLGAIAPWLLVTIQIGDCLPFSVINKAINEMICTIRVCILFYTSFFLTKIQWTMS